MHVENARYVHMLNSTDPFSPDQSKCDNLQPSCSTCKAHNTECLYEKPPSLAYVRALEEKIESLSSSKSPDLRSTSSLAATTPDHALYVQQSKVGDTASSEGTQWVSQISVDGRGSLTYHNPTSAIHEAPSPTIDDYSVDEVLEVSQQSNGLLTDDAAQSFSGSRASERGLTLGGDFSVALEGDFLRYYWCWIHPMFMIVYRPAFTRRLASLVAFLS
jgi:hypothetical protein